MAIKTNPYKILGVSPDSSDQEIKRAYNKLIKAHHPDVNSDKDSQRKLLLIKKAYEFIVKKRKSSLIAGDFSAISDTSISVYKKDINTNDVEIVRQKHQFHVFDIDVLSAQKGGNFSDYILVSNYCDHCSGSGVEESSYDNNICYDCAGSGFVKSSYGVMRIQKKCESCDGSGISKQKSCHNCHGLGEIKQRKEFSFTLPPHSHSGYQLELPPVLGECDVDKYDYLVLSIHVNAIEGFVLDEDGVSCLICDIDYIQYLIGGLIYIPELDLSVDIPEGSNDDTDFAQFIEAEDNKFNIPIKIKFNVGGLQSLNPLSIPELRDWYHKFYK